MENKDTQNKTHNIIVIFFFGNFPRYIKTLDGYATNMINKEMTV
jgi:hypothetical protein